MPSTVKLVISFLCFVCSTLSVNALLLPPKFQQRIPISNVLKTESQIGSKFLTGISGALLTIPTAAFADGDGALTAVGIPLAISVLVMVPFLYYQQ